METPEKTPAERHYENVKKANREYYRRKNPIVKRSRMPKVDPVLTNPDLTKPDLVSPSQIQI